MRIVIYARGRLLKTYSGNIEWKHIAAIVDKSAGEAETFKNVPVLRPNLLDKLQYDYIAIFSNQYFEEIRSELVGMFFVPPYKIVSWKAITDCPDSNYESVCFVRNYFEHNNINHALDTDNSCVFRFFFTKASFCESIKRLDKIGELTYSIEKNLYDCVYADLKNIDCTSYDVVTLWNFPEDLEVIKNILKISKICLILVEYREYMLERVYTSIQELELFGEVQFFQCDFGVVWEIKRKHEIIIPSTHIYVVTHKEYNVLNDSLYKPIAVGQQYENNQFLSEHNGENISYLNDKINECTALYWIWKNTNDVYVGLNHYRRYFCNNSVNTNGNFLKSSTIAELLKDYDIILSDLHILPHHTVSEQVRLSVQDDVIYQKGYDLIQDGIAAFQPNYLDAFETVMNGHKEFICNLFVTKREILNLYCEWLFSFLIYAAEKMDISQCNNNSKRVIGFFAERMWTVWLLRQDLRIKELPFLLGM